jgi:hypothetical protein
VHFLRGKALPRDSGWPLDLRYASGLTLVEIERTLPNGSYLSIEMIKSPEFSRRMQAAVREVHQEHGAPPGLILPRHPTLEALAELTSLAHPDDPLIRTFRPDFLKNWKPCLKEGDFVQARGGCAPLNPRRGLRPLEPSLKS